MSEPSPARLPRLGSRLRRAAELCLLLGAVGLLAALSLRHALIMDWTANARNTLSPASQSLLQHLSGPVRVQAFVDDTPSLRRGITQLVERYQRFYPSMSLELVDPALQPRLAREANVTSNGVLLVEHAEKIERVTTLSERALTSALNRLARAQERWIAFVSGAGERDLLGDARTDLGGFGAHLQELGFRLRPVNPAQGAEVPDNVSVLVVLEPTTALLPGTRETIEAYLARGGNLLWLSDARHHDDLASLERLLGVRREQGMLVDPTSQLYGRSTPEFILVTGYADHPVTTGMTTSSAFPTITSLAWESVAGWKIRGLAASSLSSWLETGDLALAVRFDEGEDTPGPLDLAVVLERSAEDGPQRAAVFGDADFLSNAYLGLAGNKAMGRSVVSWLANDDDLIDVPTIRAVDLDFAPSPLVLAIIGLGAPAVLPLLILCVGALLWRRRRAR